MCGWLRLESNYYFGIEALRSNLWSLFKNKIYPIGLPPGEVCIEELKVAPCGTNFYSTAFEGF